MTIDNLSNVETSARVDKWLWAVRIFKTRAQATAACRASSVEVDGQIAKPSRDVRGGELIEVRQGIIKRTLRVLGLPRSRVGAKLSANYCTDLTPPEEFQKLQNQRVQHILAREKGSGRPTKRERRAIDRLFG